MIRPIIAIKWLFGYLYFFSYIKANKGGIYDKLRMFSLPFMVHKNFMPLIQSKSTSWINII